MITAVDSNVLLDVLDGSPAFAPAARQALAGALRDGSLLICSVVYTELAAGLPDQIALAQFLHDLGIQLDDFAMPALQAAASAWRTYTRRRGLQVQCSRCGHRAAITCARCQAPIVWRQHLIADFLIGGHAIVQADRLLTRDRGLLPHVLPAAHARAALSARQSLARKLRRCSPTHPSEVVCPHAAVQVAHAPCRRTEAARPARAEAPLVAWLGRSCRNG